MDLSKAGARLRPNDPLGLPESFSLHLRDSDELACRVTWRAGHFLGVSFVDGNQDGDPHPTDPPRR